MKPEQAPLLTVDRLTIQFVHRAVPVPVLDEVCFDLARGEVLGMVGESGAGKSMLAAALLGLLPRFARVASGSIHWEGQRIDDLPERHRARLRGCGIGWIPQESLNALDPLYTVGEQLIETLRTHASLPALQAREQALGLLDAVGLAATAQTLSSYAHQLSGGMRQRVVIALTLAAGPRLIVADEPTTALDVSTQRQVVRLLKRLCEERHMAMLLITHDMAVLKQVADRIAVLYAGRIVEIGLANRILQSPQHPYTAGLIGAIPRLEARAERLTQIEGTMPRLGHIPAGCAFHPRCPRRFAPCDVERPPLIQTGITQAACWLYRPVAMPV